MNMFSDMDRLMTCLGIAEANSSKRKDSVLGSQAPN